MGLKVDAILSSDLLTVVKDNVSRSIVVESTDGKVSSFVNKVITSISSTVDGGLAKISVMRLWGHGITHFADGGTFPNGNVLFGKEQPDRDEVFFSTFDKFSGDLGRLTPYFEQGARVELRGCSTARGEGKKLMIALADLWQVEIDASENSQSLVTVWDRPVYVAKPGLKAVGTTRGIDINE